MDRLRILVLHGGASAEREVSLASGRAVAGALTEAGHDVQLSDIRPDDLTPLDGADVDMVFPVLHGTWGEDGRLQTILEQRGFDYVGAGATASALAMDKHGSKERFHQAGLPTPRWEVWDDWPGGYDGSFPVIVKPVAEGSSVALVKANTQADLCDAADSVCAAYGQCLVEQFIPGRELTVAVLGEEALPPLEIIVSDEHETYDYRAKYHDESTVYRTDPALEDRTREGVRETALAAFRLLGCRDYGRVDFRLHADGTPYLLEVNTIPGFTRHSLVPMAARAVGLEMPALCDRLVEIAWRRTRA